MTKYRTLVGLLNTDERTFYALLRERTADLLPVLYTPTVGDACLQYGTLTQRPPGLTVSLNDLGPWESCWRRGRGATCASPSSPTASASWVWATRVRTAWA